MLQYLLFMCGSGGSCTANGCFPSCSTGGTGLHVLEFVWVERGVQGVAEGGHDPLSVEIVTVLRPPRRGQVHEGLPRGERHG
jgi:hypothetical protein